MAFFRNIFIAAIQQTFFFSIVARVQLYTAIQRSNVRECARHIRTFKDASISASKKMHCIRWIIKLPLVPIVSCVEKPSWGMYCNNGASFNFLGSRLVIRQHKTILFLMNNWFNLLLRVDLSTDSGLPSIDVSNVKNPFIAEEVFIPFCIVHYNVINEPNIFIETISFYSFFVISRFIIIVIIIRCRSQSELCG